MNEPTSSLGTFRKKTYCKLVNSPLGQSIPSDPLAALSKSQANKKIVPSLATKGLREEFKKTFLPLLIDIFELRQAIDTHKAANESSLPIGKVAKSPTEILKRLEQLQQEIEESQRWCEGVIVQIAKGIHEAKEILSFLKPNNDSSTS
ncbi:MAG: hypothetical protein AAF443_05570 [Chlamydiota bacterium]